MVNIIVQVSKYVLLALMVFFTIETYMVLQRRDDRSRRRIMRKQILLMVLFNMTAYGVMFVVKREQIFLFMFLLVTGYILIVQILYRVIYRKASLILLNTMCMLLSVGLVIQTRLGTDKALKQFIIAAVSTMLCFIIPVFVRKVRWVARLTWVYAAVGVLLLAAVFLLGRVTGGAILNLTIAGISFQFSEFVKITVVLFMAGMLQEKHDFKTVMITTVVAAVHVGILALSADLGAALVYFVAYIVMVFVATRNPGYAFLGLGGMAGASVVAYKMFAHVRTRVAVWRDPFLDYEGTGYQIVQALFGLCAGGWFGTGLFRGNPEMIPLAYEDFTFAAIAEEFGILFAICLILLCMGMYLLIINIAMRLEKPFYKLVALGLGSEYAFQVFLTIGGTTKFIPMTGITLPLVSYGGSSVMCTIMMISIIQGLYILRKDENREQLSELRSRIEQERMEQARRWAQKEAGPQTTYRQQPVTKQIPEYQDELTKRIEKQTEEGIAFRDH
ncbi:MAG: FtsW/RodA/SpoVE family cell cycle protein [Eubacterium sp.]|nr:FtsW/RodA/SpoVE family cell cycle protein [Eubacterium sp.]